MSKQSIPDMILMVGFVEGRLDAAATLLDGKARQIVLDAKSSLSGVADDLIEMLEDDDEE